MTVQFQLFTSTIKYFFGTFFLRIYSLEPSYEATT